MAKKKLNPLEDPPAASSSDEEEMETFSGEEEKEEEEEVEEQISDDSSSEEEHELLNPVNIPSGKKPKPKPPSAAAVTDAVPGRFSVASGSESSPSRPGSKKAVAVTAAEPNEKEIRGSPAAKSGKKRPDEKTAKEANAKRAKKKIAEETKKPSFQRLWSEEDEISLLQGMIDFKAETGKSPYEDMDGFYQLIVKSISFKASKNQFMDKIRSLKKKYMRKVKNGVESFSKAHDNECLRLAKCIWGSNGMSLQSAVKSNVKKSDSLKPHGKVVEEVESALKSNGSLKKSEKKLDSLEANGKRVEEDKEVLIDGEKVEEDKEVLVNGGVSESLGGRETTWFENSFLVRSIASFGVDEYSVKQRWSVLPMETKKRITEKWKLLQAKEFEVVLQKTDFLNEVASVIAEAN